MALKRSWPVLIAFMTWSLAALASLLQQTWRTEAGSLAPLLLAFGGWTLYECSRRHAHLAREGDLRFAAALIMLVMPIYLFASAIDMVAVMAACVWVAGVAAFYFLHGRAVTRACAFPLAFIGLVVPLPYSLSLPANILLRNYTARIASDVAESVGMDTAVDRQFLFVGQYQLAIDTACAGLNSTMSLVAVGLLFAYWTKGFSRSGAIICLLVAFPVALLANILRIVALMILVIAFGPEVLASVLHPLSGVLSFSFALALFALAIQLSTAASNRRVQ